MLGLPANIDRILQKISGSKVIGHLKTVVCIFISLTLVDSWIGRKSKVWKRIMVTSVASICFSMEKGFRLYYGLTHVVERRN